MSKTPCMHQCMTFSFPPPSWWLPAHPVRENIRELALAAEFEYSHSAFPGLYCASSHVSQGLYALLLTWEQDSTAGRDGTTEARCHPFYR